MMALIKIICVFIVFNTHFISVDTVLEHRPQSTLARFKGLTNLTCCSSINALQWKHHKFNDEEGYFQKICENATCRYPKYVINNSSFGCFHLIIYSTSEDDSGLYQCSEIGRHKNEIALAYLIVFSLNCSQSSGKLVEGDTEKFECASSWKGKLPFKIQWISVEDESIHSQETIYDVKDVYYSYYLVNVTRPILQSYTFQLGFINEGIQDGLDQSCPTVNWTSSPIKVEMHPASKIKTNCPHQPCDKVIGDSLECSSEGYPDPDIHWVDWNGTIVSFDKQLKLMGLGHHEYICIANNTLRGKRHEISMRVVVNVVPHEKGSNSESESLTKKDLWDIAHNVLNTMLLIAIGLLVVTVYRRVTPNTSIKMSPKHSKNQHEEKPDESLCMSEQKVFKEYGIDSSNRYVGSQVEDDGD